jgi:16S rRNA (cytosine967-C5)-methyltransferase
LGLSVAREIAYDAFIEVMEQKKRPEDVLDAAYESQRGKNLKRIDRNLIKEIVFGGLRWYSKIYWILQNTSERDLATTTAEIRSALVLGTYQIYYMDRVPDRAAVNESVEYVRKKGQANACPFVNGILRQIARRAEYFAKPDKDKEPVNYLALQFAHPRWIVERWSRHYKFDRLENMLSSNNTPPPLTVRINTLKTETKDAQQLQQELLRSERTHSEKRNLRCSLRFKEFPNMEEDSLFNKGFYTIQDEASQLISFIVNPQPGEVIIDACAGPGGKLSHIYELSKGQAKYYAIDRSKTQFAKAQETLKRLGHEENITWIQEDFLTWNAKEKVDKVLLDAPCSGLGVLRRHPEGKWQKDAGTVSTLSSKQKDLIEHALKQLKKGGELIYSVCSFEPEEAIDHLNWLKTKYEDKIEVVTPVAHLPDYFKKYVTRQNVLVIYSGNQDDMDGFSAFCVRVKEEFS